MKSAEKLSMQYVGEVDTRFERFACWILGKIHVRRDEVEKGILRNQTEGAYSFWGLFNEGAEFGPDPKFEITISQDDVLGPCEKVRIRGMTHIVEKEIANAIRADERRKAQEEQTPSRKDNP